MKPEAKWQMQAELDAKLAAPATDWTCPHCKQEYTRNVALPCGHCAECCKCHVWIPNEQPDATCAPPCGYEKSHPSHSPWGGDHT